MRDIILDLKPDVVLFLVGGNDVARRESGVHTASHIKGSLRFDSAEAFVKSASAYSEVAATLLNIYRYLRARREGLAHRHIDLRSLPHSDTASVDQAELFEDHSNIYIPAYEQRLRTLIRLAKESDIEPVLITQPMLFGEGIDPVTGVNLGTAIIRENTTGRRAWTVLELYNDATLRMGEQENVLTIDLARELEKNSTFFYDALHFTNAGSAEIGRILYAHLKPHLMEKYGSNRDNAPPDRP
jgi:lysophospholipase L1-like esterase